MKQRPFVRGVQFLAAIGGGVVLAGCLEADSEVVPRYSNSDTPAITRAEPEIAAAAPETLSPAIAEIVKLAQSNVSEDIILTYIANASVDFNPSADEILYLKDLGMSDRVITAVIDLNKARQALATAVPAAPEDTPLSAPSSPPAQAEYDNAYTPPPTQEVAVDYFYKSLAPYGSWVNVDGYGLCWRPTVVSLNSHWRPYCDNGRWIYSDCGWYWQSDYTWGWAPFHYGRWHRAPRHGWVWIPDYTWGPAWVSWRYSSDYCGWAPLPPSACYRPGFGFTFRSSHVGISFEFGLTDDCYTFVSSRRLCDPHPYRHCLPRTDVTKIYNHTTVNNYYIYNNTRVINKGITPENVAAVRDQTRREVPIRDAAGRPGSSKHDIIDKKSNTLLVYRPQPPVNLTSASGRVAREESRNSSGANPFTPAASRSNSTTDKSSSAVAAKRDEAPRPVPSQRPVPIRPELTSAETPAQTTTPPVIRRSEISKPTEETPHTRPTPTTRPGYTSGSIAPKIDTVSPVSPRPSEAWVKPNRENETRAHVVPKPVTPAVRAREAQPIFPEPVIVNKIPRPSQPERSYPGQSRPTPPQVYTPPTQFSQPQASTSDSATTESRSREESGRRREASARADSVSTPQPTQPSPASRPPTPPARTEPVTPAPKVSEPARPARPESPSITAPLPTYKAGPRSEEVSRPQPAPPAAREHREAPQQPKAPPSAAPREDSKKPGREK